MVEPMLNHCQFVWMSKPYAHTVLFYSGLYRSTTLSDVHLTTLAGCAVKPWSPQSQVILHWMKETGDLPRQQSNTFDVVFGQHSAEPDVCRLDIWKKSDCCGLLFWLTGSNFWVEGLLGLFDTISCTDYHTSFPPNHLRQPY